MVKGTEAQGGKQPRLRCVGIIQGVRLATLAQKAADNRARTACSKFVKILVAALDGHLVKRSGTRIDLPVSNPPPEIVESELKRLSLRWMDRLRVTDRWVDPRDNAAHSLVEIQQVTLLEEAKKVKQLTARQRAKLEKVIREFFPPPRGRNTDRAP